MKILGIIPARIGSKSLRFKNIKIFNGRPLIYWSIISAKKSLLNKVIVSTDSKKIKNIALKYNCEVPFIRPKNISDDKTKGIKVMQHALNYYKNKNLNFDAVMLLQPTCPFRTKDDINKAIKIFKEKKPDSVISLVDVEGFHPARMNLIKKNKIVKPDFAERIENIRRQDLKKIYLRSGAIYLVKNTVLNKNSLIGKISKPIITPKSRSFNIDTKLDFEIAELYAKKIKLKS